MSSTYDIIIVGGGPAGIFAALELSKASGLSILLLEKGKDIDERRSLVCGLGGAGAFSDGKLTLTWEVGGRLKEYVKDNDLDDLIKYIDNIYLKFGGSDRLYGVGEGVDEWCRRASLAGLRLLPVPLRHLGTERCRSVLKAMRDYLNTHIEFRLNTRAKNIIVDNGEVRGVETEGGDRFNCHYLILAPGREGADWLSREAKRIDLTMHNNPVDVGVRVEVPVSVMEELTNVLYEAKLDYLSKSFDDRIRTFCMCPAGEVIMETTGGNDPVVTVNGHSYADLSSDNTNFALLVSTQFTEPFREPIAYGKYLARLANILSGGVLVQRLGDLMQGHRSTAERISRGIVQPTLKEATPGDLSFVLPYRYLTGIVEMIQAMDRLAPGVASRHTLLYGVEVKFYSSRLQLNSSLETEVRHMFAVGDGAGVSRGLIQASASGVIVGRQILKEMGQYQ